MRHTCLAAKRQQIMKEGLWFENSSEQMLLHVQMNELGDMIKVTLILKHWYCLLTGCLTSSQWRIVCFKSTSCFFFLFFFCLFSTDGLLKVKIECAATR